jgi:hypothetical protein
MKTHLDDSREIEDLVRLTQEVVTSPTDDSKMGEWRAAREQFLEALRVDGRCLRHLYPDGL